MNDDNQTENNTEHLQRLNAALALREIPDYPAALTQLQKAKKLAQSDSSVLVLLGLAYQDLGKYQKAEQTFQAVLNIDATNHEAMQSLGLLLVEQDKYQQAIEYLSPLTEDNEHNLPVQQALATALVKTGDEETALEILYTAYKHFPDEPELIAQLGRLLLQTGEIEAATTILNNALENGLDLSIDAICDLSAAYSLQENYPHALAILNNIKNIYQNNDRVWRGMAYCQFKLGKYKQALQNIEVALRLNANYFRNLETKANILDEMGKVKDALVILEQAIEYVDKTSDNYGRLIFDYLLKTWKYQGYNPALKLIEEKYEDVVNEKISLISLYKEILFDAKQFEEALHWVEKAESKGVSIEQIIWDYIRAHVLLNQFSEAESKLEKFFSSTQKMPYKAAIKYGFRYYLQNEIAVTKFLWEYIYQKDPTNPEILNNFV